MNFSHISEHVGTTRYAVAGVGSIIFGNLFLVNIINVACKVFKHLNQPIHTATLAIACIVGSIVTAAVAFDAGIFFLQIAYNHHCKKDAPPLSAYNWRFFPLSAWYHFGLLPQAYSLPEKVGSGATKLDTEATSTYYLQS